jgi:hypothetical protein
MNNTCKVLTSLAVLATLGADAMMGSMTTDELRTKYPDTMTDAELRQVFKSPQLIPTGPGFLPTFVQAGLNSNAPDVRESAAMLALLALSQNEDPEYLRDRAQRTLVGHADPDWIAGTLEAGPRNEHDQDYWDAVHGALDNRRLLSIRSVQAALESGNPELAEKAKWALKDRYDIVRQLLEDLDTLRNSEDLASMIVSIGLSSGDYDMCRRAAAVVFEQGVVVQPKIRAYAEEKFVRDLDQAQPDQALRVLQDPRHPLHQQAIRLWLNVAQFPDLQRLAVIAAQASDNPAIRLWLNVAQFPDLQRLAVTAAQASDNPELQERAQQIEQEMAQFWSER